MSPAQAAYEAFTDGLGAPAWDLLDPAIQQRWTNVANASVFSVLHCDSHDHRSGLRVGQEVYKAGGDYTFRGRVAVIFAKRAGQVRLVVENPDGMLMILNPAQVEAVQ
jgi:hypothetical protein